MRGIDVSHHQKLIFCPDCGYTYQRKDMVEQCDERGDKQLVCDRCSSVRDGVLR